MQKRTDSQINAERKYNKKRKGAPMIPIIYLTEKEAAQVERLRKRFGSKKAAVLFAIQTLCDVLDATEKET